MLANNPLSDMSFMKWEVRPLAEGVLGGGKGQGSEGGEEKGESETVTAECRGATRPQSRPGAPWALGDGCGTGTAEPPGLLTLPPSCSTPTPTPSLAAQRQTQREHLHVPLKSCRPDQRATDQHH